MLRGVKITTKNTSWTTSMSATLTDEDINNYFKGKYFDVGNYPDEVMEKVIKVEILR